MRLMIIKAAFVAALPFALAAPALADAQRDQLMKLCTENEPDPSTCECQVKALVENIDAKILKVYLAMVDGGEDDTIEQVEARTKAALEEAGMTEEEFQKAMEEAMPKVEPMMEACKA